MKLASLETGSRARAGICCAASYRNRGPADADCEEVCRAGPAQGRVAFLPSLPHLGGQKQVRPDGDERLAMQAGGH